MSDEQKPKKRKRDADVTPHASKAKRRAPRRVRDEARAQVVIEAATAQPKPTLQQELRRELTTPRLLGMLLLVVGVSVAYVRNLLGDAQRPYLLVGIGLSAFAFGTSSGMNPRRVVVLCGALVAAGLALVGTRDSSIGVALCLAGGLGLGGGIHRLGRMGPDEEDDLQTQPP